MQDFDADDEAEAHHLLEALWLHQQHGARDEALLDRLLSSDVKHAVVAANTVKHFWYDVDSSADEFMAPPELEFVTYKPPKHLSGPEKKVYKRGAEIYQREAHCATCHLTHGKGNTNVYPTLVDSPWVLGDEERLIKATLHGLWGKMTVNGETYDPARGVPPMTAFKSLLKDDELAAVLTFVRNTWGNKAAAVAPETVARVREATRERSIFFKPDELLAEHPLEEMFVARGEGAAAEEFSNVALEQELMAADVSELARVALDRGNVQRGRKLFYESSAACYACHDPPKGAARLGPDLTSLKTTLSPEQLVNSLLRPSELIDKAYAQVSVLDVDGQVQMGIRVSESESEIVLRNLAAPDPITIQKADIDELQESAVSLMPENLVRQLRSRKEFDDLVRYILEVRAP